MSNSLKPRNEDAERLGLYDLLAGLETEWAAYKKDCFRHSSIVADAIIIAIHKVREQIGVFETNAMEQAAIEGQMVLNAELNDAVEMKVSA